MALNIALVIVVIFVLLAFILVFWFGGLNWLKPNPLTQSDVKTERGLIYFDCKHGLAIIDKIEENVESNIYKLRIRTIDGTLHPEYEVHKDAVDIVNPGRTNELWRDLSVLPRFDKLTDALKREKLRGDYHEKEHMLLKANMQKEVDKRVEQALRALPQYKQFGGEFQQKR